MEIWSCHGGWLLRVERGISPKYFVAGSDFIVHTEKTIHNLIPRNNVNLDNTLVTKFLISWSYAASKGKGPMTAALHTAFILLFMVIKARDDESWNWLRNTNTGMNCFGTNLFGERSADSTAGHYDTKARQCTEHVFLPINSTIFARNKGTECVTHISQDSKLGNVGHIAGLKSKDPER